MKLKGFCKNTSERMIVPILIPEDPECDLQSVASLPSLLVESPDGDKNSKEKESKHEGGRRAEQLVQPVTGIKEKKGGDGDDKTPGA
jgi:hypothetical protein